MFLNPLGLLALLGVPAVIALHLFRRRFQPRVVSALFLWDVRTTTSLSGRRRDRILRSPSFWTELLLALLIGIAIAGPRACSGMEARHLVVVLDASASMSARPTRLSDGALSPSFAEETVRRVASQIDALPGGSRVTLVTSGARPQILSGPAAFPEEALARLNAYPALATAGRHALEPATSLALQLAGDGAVTLYTDHFEPDRYPPEVGVIALGRGVANLAITRANRIPGRGADAGNDRILLTLANLSPQSHSGRLALDLDGRELAAQPIALEPRERKHYSFDIPHETPALRVTTDGDGFALDDEALLVAPPLRALRLGSALDETTERQLGLTGGESELDRWIALVERSTRAADPESAHILIANAPLGGPRSWCLVLHEPAGDPLDLVGPFLIERRHPLLAGILLDGVVWSASEASALPGLPIVSAGNRPLLTEERDASRTIFHMDLNVARSSLHRSPDWPILLDNLAELRRRDLVGPERTSLATGESFRYRGSGAGEYTLETPDGSRELRARDTLVIDDLDAVGMYTLRRDGERLADFAVHFGDDAESNLTALNEGERASSVVLAEQRAGSSWVELLLATLALGALLFDWHLLRPRRAAAGLAEVAR